MTIERTLPPPKEKPWFPCEDKTCPNFFQAYHGKVGCWCDECEDAAMSTACVGICTLDDDGTCIGCFRKIKQILRAGW